MKTRAQDLLDEAARFLDYAAKCTHIWPDCVACDIRREHVLDCARAALLSTLRKRRLELEYFVDAERATLDAQLREMRGR